MGLLKIPAARYELPSYELVSEAPAEGEFSKVAVLDDDSGSLRAFRGIAFGVVLGSIMWAVIGIAWVLL